MPDSPGEAAAREGLRDSVHKNRTEVALAGETIDLLRSEIRIAVTAGIQAGLAEALNEENAELLFGAFVKAFQTQAQVQTGRWVLGRISSALTVLFWVCIGGWAIYSVGGWAGLKLAWAIAPKGTP